MTALSTGLKSGLSVGNVHVVKSNDFDNVYFVAGDLQGPGLEGSSDIALWASNRDDGSAGFFSVDAAANEFSDWGDGRSTDAEFSSSDDGASEAMNCAQG